MPLFSLKKLTTSAIFLLTAAFALHAQTLSGYTGSTSMEDGYKGNISKVTITKTLFKTGTTEKTEILYDSKGRCIAQNKSGQSTKYTYSGNSFIETTEGLITAKASFDSNGNLKKYTTYNPEGKIILYDEYSYKNGKISGMERIDGQGRPVATWTYSIDSDGNTLIQNEAASSLYTYSPAGILIKEYKQFHENAFIEILYDDDGNELSYKFFYFPSQAIKMLGDIPITDIIHTRNSITDDEGRTKEVTTNSFNKMNDKWYDSDGNIVSSEVREIEKIKMEWYSYRYDGKLAEVQTEHWVQPSEENLTGYSSLAEEYFYNNDGMLTQIVAYDERGNETERLVHKYDDDGLLYSTTTTTEPIELAFYTWNDKELLESKITHITFIAEDDPGYSFNTYAEEYEYDKNENISKISYTSIFRLTLNGSSPVQSASFKETSFSYDEDNLLLKKKTREKKATTTEYYAYDDLGRKTLSSMLTETENEKPFYTETSYRYEPDGDLTKVTEYESVHTKKVYTYNEIGNIARIDEYEIWYIDGAYKDMITSVTEYKYN